MDDGKIKVTEAVNVVISCFDWYEANFGIRRSDLSILRKNIIDTLNAAHGERNEKEENRIMADFLKSCRR